MFNNYYLFNYIFKNCFLHSFQFCISDNIVVHVFYKASRIWKNLVLSLVPTSAASDGSVGLVWSEGRTRTRKNPVMNLKIAGDITSHKIVNLYVD